MILGRVLVLLGSLEHFFQRWKRNGYSDIYTGYCLSFDDIAKCDLFRFSGVISSALQRKVVKIGIRKEKKNSGIKQHVTSHLVFKYVSAGAVVWRKTDTFA